MGGWKSSAVVWLVGAGIVEGGSSCGVEVLGFLANPCWGELSTVPGGVVGVGGCGGRSGVVGGGWLDRAVALGWVSTAVWYWSFLPWVTLQSLVAGRCSLATCWTYDGIVFASMAACWLGWLAEKAW